MTKKYMITKIKINGSMVITGLGPVIPGAVWAYAISHMFPPVNN
jgi:hypothetical protein